MFFAIRVLLVRLIYDIYYEFILYKHIYASIPPEDIPCVHFLFHVIQTRIVAVGDDGVALGLEGGEIVDYAAAEERGAVGQGRLVDYHLRAFGLYALHHALDARLAEVVGV